MDRRNFITGFGALVGGIALEKAISFNRVWSFPKDIKIANRQEIEAYAYEMMNKAYKEFQAELAGYRFYASGVTLRWNPLNPNRLEDVRCADAMNAVMLQTT